MYPLVDRLICLILILSMSTATSERAFLAMKVVRTRLPNKIEDRFLVDNLVVHIEREIAKNFTSILILDNFRFFKECRLCVFG